MAKVHPIFTSFTTGEVTPLLSGRVDFAKYAAGLRTLINYVIRPHGPVFRRSGTRFVAAVKDSTKFTRLLKFEFSTDQAYIIEAGDLYFRFYKDGGRIESPPGTPVEVVTPYTATDLPLLKFVQSADTMYFVHPSHAPRKLQRLSHTSWTLTTVNWLPPATYEGGFAASGVTLTLSATSGLGITVTASAAHFDASGADNGRMIDQLAGSGGTGRLIIRSTASTTSATADVVDTFSTTSLTPGNWNMEGSPNATCTPSGLSTNGGPRHAIGTFTLTAPASGFRSTDVGRYIRINRGVVRVTKFVGVSQVEAEVLSDLQNLTASPGGSWSVEDPAWSASRGYPRAIAFFEQRLILAGSSAQPQAFWGSNTGDYEVIALGADDDDAFEFAIAANEVNTINWIVPTRVMLMGTASSEFTVQGSAGATNPAITPNNVDVKPSTFWGSSNRIQPPRVGLAALFVSRAGTEVRELIFSSERDAYVANNLLLLADHLTEGTTIVDMAHQQHPSSTVWCVRSDGVLLCLTYQREHEVAGWSRMFTGNDFQTVTPVKGKFESVAVIPHWQGDRDVAWFVVARSINGVTKRYVEYMDDLGGHYQHVGHTGGGLGVDCALTYNGTPVSGVTGLSHLEGETVSIVGDGAVYTDKVVTGGAVALDGPTASQIDVGLNFYSKLETVRPEVPSQGTSQGLMKHWSRIWVRCERTVGMFINDEEKPFRSPQDNMDAHVPPFTGDVPHINVGRDRDGIITVEQRQPLPQTIIAIFGTLSVGE